MAKGRDLSAAFEAKVALEAIKGHKTINEIATESTETFWMKKCEVMGSAPSFTLEAIKGHKTINEIATESTETFWMKKCEVMGSDPSFTMSMIAERLRIL